MKSSILHFALLAKSFRDMPLLTGRACSPAALLISLEDRLLEGVPYYWVIDPEDQAIAEYVLEGSAYRLNRTAGEKEPFQPHAFPDLTISLEDVFNSQQ